MATQRFAVTAATQADARKLQERLVAIHGVLYASVCLSDASAEIEFEDDEVTVEELGRAIEQSQHN